MKVKVFCMARQEQVEMYVDDPTDICGYCYEGGTELEASEMSCGMGYHHAWMRCKDQVACLNRRHEYERINNPIPYAYGLEYGKVGQWD